MISMPTNLRFPTFSDMGYSRSMTSGKGITAAYWKGPGMQVVRPTTATRPIMEGSRVIVWPDASAGASTADLPGNDWRFRVPRTSEDVTNRLDAARSFSLPYRRSVSTTITELRSSRQYGPESLPSFEDFVAGLPLGPRPLAFPTAPARAPTTLSCPARSFPSPTPPPPRLTRERRAPAAARPAGGGGAAGGRVRGHPRGPGRPPRRRPAPPAPRHRPQ